MLTSLAGRHYQFTDTEGRQIPLLDGVSRIGRDPAGNEIELDDPLVSSRHAAIEVSPRSVVLRDLGSRNGTWVNGEPLTHAAVIHEGDTVKIGGRKLTLVRRESVNSGPPRGIAKPLASTSLRAAEPAPAQHLTTALATMALTLLSMLLNGVALADGFQRDDLPLPLAVLLLGLIGLPLIAITVLATGRRSGYLLAVIAATVGLIWIAATGPILAGSGVRDELTAEYGSTGFWFIGAASIFAMVFEILVLTVSFAGWRAAGQPGPAATYINDTHGRA